MKWALLIAFFWLAALALYAISIITRRSARVSTKRLFGVHISEQDFEAQLQRGFRHRGYLVEGSQGSYLVMRRGGEVTLVCYQRWDEPYRVKKRVVQLRRAMQAQGAAGGKLVCGFALPRRVETSLHAGAIDCVGPAELKALLLHQTAQDVARDADLVTSFRPDIEDSITQPGSGSRAVHDEEPKLVSVVPLPPPEHSPRCPRCNSEMALETAEGGGADGQLFWRCVRAPQCKGIRSAAPSLRSI